MAGGKLFAEDVGGADWHFDHPQRVWVRQWNPGSHEAGPCVLSKGATIWALGLKSGIHQPKIPRRIRRADEILGSFISPIGKISEDHRIFENRDSRLAFVLARASISRTTSCTSTTPAAARRALQQRSTQMGRQPRADGFVCDGWEVKPRRRGTSGDKGLIIGSRKEREQTISPLSYSEPTSKPCRTHLTSIQSSVAFSGAGRSNVTVKPSAVFSETARLQSHDCSIKTA